MSTTVVPSSVKLTPGGPRIDSTDELKRMANRVRIEIIKMIGAAGSGHPGGSLSEVELLAALYFRVLRHDPKNPAWRERDRFILSKGHGCPALYAMLAEAGYIDPAILPTLRKLGSPLQGHPDRRMLPVLEASTGSLGQGLSIGIGMALAARLDKLDYHTFVMVGDGEIQEGQNWEAAMFAPYHKLSNLTVIVDYNHQQLDGFTKDILDVDPLAAKFSSFGWNAVEIDGHNFDQVIPALEKARANTSGKPTTIIANTVKGKGVSFMENNPKWHGVAPKPEEVAAAVKELESTK
ncbi:MAG TPA: transketolase [Terriglobales bacterium]|jgi:transketolase|nr:transketolase [Terriglobales bacterium]